MLFLKLINKDQQTQIVNAIKEAELNTSGEIRVHVEEHCKVNVMDRAAYVFALLKMHKTQLRNGVLFYLSIKDRKFAILGDGGINKTYPYQIEEHVFSHARHLKIEATDQI